MSHSGEDSLNILTSPDGALPEEIVKALQQYVAWSADHYIKYQSNWDNAINIVAGKHWDDDDEFLATFNMTGNAVTTAAAWLTDRTPRLLVYPFSENTPGEKADTMKEYINAEWVLNRWSEEVAEVYRDNYTLGVGIARCGWDEYARRGRGGPFIMRVDPYDFIPYPKARRLDQCWAVTCVSEPTVLEIIRDYPHVAEQERIDSLTTDGSGFKLKRRKEATMGGGGPEYKAQGHGGKTDGNPAPYPVGSDTGNWSEEGKGTLTKGSVGRSIRKFEVWVQSYEPGSKVPSFYVYVFAGDVLLDMKVEKFLPFSHYTFMNPRNEFVSVGLPEYMFSIQFMRNSLATQIWANARETANNQLAMSDAVKRMQTDFTNRPGKIWVTPPGQVDQIKPIQGQSMPAFVFDLFGAAAAQGDQDSGIHAFLKGEVNVRRETATTVESYQEASFVTIRSTARRNEKQTEKLLTTLMNIVAEFQIEGMRIPLPSVTSTSKFLDLNTREFQTPAQEPSVDPNSGAVAMINKRDENGLPVYDPMEFYAYFDAGSSMAITRQQREGTAKFVYQEGVGDDQYLLQELEVEDADELLRRKAERVQSEQKQSVSDLERAYQDPQQQGQSDASTGFTPPDQQQQSLTPPEGADMSRAGQSYGRSET